MLSRCDTNIIFILEIKFLIQNQINFMNFLCTNNISDKNVIVHNLSVNAPSFSITLGIFRHRKVILRNSYYR